MAAARPTDTLVVATTGAAVVLAGLTGLAYARPATTAGTRDTGVRHEATLGYEAAAPVGPVYQDGRVTTGEPVFRALVPNLGVRVDYRLAGPGAAAAGSVTTFAVVRDERGWSYRVPLGEPVRFTGTSATATSVLRLGDLDALVADVGRRTGMAAGPYTVAVSAAVSVDGSVGGDAFHERVEVPAMDLAVDRRMVRPAAAGPAAGPTMTPVRVPARLPATLSLGGRRVGVGTARAAAGVAAVAAALASVALRLAARRRAGRTEPEALAARYVRHVVDVVAVTVPADRTVVEVASVEALVDLSERFGRPVLHEVRDGRHGYLVEDGRSVYRYRIAPHPGPEGDAAPARPRVGRLAVGAHARRR